MTIRSSDGNRQGIKRRWFQFTLRTLLLVMAAAAVGLAWLGNGLQRARRQRAAVVQLRTAGFDSLYDYQFDADGSYVSDAEPTSPEWLRSVLGRDVFHDVAGVYVFHLSGETLEGLELVRDLPTFSRLRVRFVLFPGPMFRDVANLRALREVRSLSFSIGEQLPSDEDLRHIRKLDNVEDLYLNAISSSLNGGPALSDVGASYLENFKTLKALDLSFNNITDAGLIHLRGLTKLETLNLTGTHTTDAGLVHLERLVKLKYLYLAHVTDGGLAHLTHLKALEYLSFYKSPGVTDEGLSHIKRLPSLKFINLHKTSVTAEGAAELKRDMEQLTISIWKKKKRSGKASG